MFPLRVSYVFVLSFSIRLFLPRDAVMLARYWDRNAVCLSVTRVLCNEINKNRTADILICELKG